MNEFGDLLREMARLPGVRAAMVATIDEGLVVDAELVIGLAGEPVAAFTASLLKTARRSRGADLLGRPDFVQVEAEGGYVFAATPRSENNLFLAVVADLGVSPGMVRVEMKRAAEVLA